MQDSFNEYTTGLVEVDIMRFVSDLKSVNNSDCPFQD